MGGEKRLNPSEKYTVFDRVKFEQLNWTGYNAELLDELVDMGNSLIKENDELKNFKKRWERENLGLSEWGKLAAGCCLLVMVIGFFVFLGIAIAADGSQSKNLKIGYKAGQIDAITNERVLYEQTSRGFFLKKDINEDFIKNGISIKEDGQEYHFNLKE